MYTNMIISLILIFGSVFCCFSIAIFAYKIRGPENIKYQTSYGSDELPVINI